MLADADDGLTKIDTTFDGDTVWLSIDQMAELFQRDRSVIGKHVRNIFKEGELQKESVWAKFAYTAADGKVYDVDYYNLDVIISVGYRVKSKRGTQFRIWATGILAVLSSLLMAFAPGLFLICAAMGLNALSNTMLFSGTDAALTYDSLKQAGQEGRYLSVAANRSQIGMLASALGSLASTLRRFYTVCALLVGGGAFLVGAAPAWGGILGMMLVQGVLEVWLLHADQRLNALISSDQRATLISVDSMAYSILMIPASPFVGAVGDLFGQAGAGLALLGVLTAAAGRRYWPSAGAEFYHKTQRTAAASGEIAAVLSFMLSSTFCKP